MSERDFNRELYPFLFEEPVSSTNGHARVEAALAEVQRSTLQKCDDVIALRHALQDEYSDLLIETARAMAAAFAQGRKLLAMGNGGSATDAQDAAADCMDPPFAGWRPLPALALVNDIGVVTAVANDVGYDNVFSRQIIAFGEPGDMALGITTSGNSPNVAAAFAEAKRRGLITIGFAGYDGGALARDGNTDYCFTARLEHIPRIQEGHATLWHTLLELVHAQLGDPVEAA
jgi:D-sedoheptulose 7-phosphate isomerase